ncbi:MAG TPA: prepilin-type N-terminal cleavage/methylation domain-containing protein [Thioploca sp.]|nr:prepilin-type N-terminal cleavage/methylation domain-containing protein [Thioploca sp.]
MKTQNAFTLIEIIVTLAVVAILTMVALPNMRSMLLNNRIISKTNDFISAINYVRTEAITRPSRNLQIQPIVQPIDTDWSNGWQIVEIISSTEQEIIKIFEYQNDQILIKKISGKCSSTDHEHSICYKARGRIQNPYKFLVCNPDYPQGARIVTIERVGRASTESCALGEGSCLSTCSAN